MDSNLLIALGGLAFSCVTFLVGAQYGKIRVQRRDRNIRIQKVADLYVSRTLQFIDSGLTGLTSAGVASLHNSSEIREAIRRIGEHGLRNPMGDHAEMLKNLDLKKLFDLIVANQIDLDAIPLEEIIAQSKE